MSLLPSAVACTRLMIGDGRIGTRQSAIARRMQRLLVAAAAVPFYGEQMRRAGYDPVRDYAGPQDLAVLRVTTKQDVKNNPLALIQPSQQGRLAGFFSDRTSGSTGIPLAVYRSASERAVQISKWMRVLVQSGWRPTHKVLSYTSPGRLTEGRSRLQRLGLLRRSAVDYTLPLQARTDALIDYAPDAVYGVRTSLLQVAEELTRRGTVLPPLRLLVAGGEVIDAATRRTCREAFGCAITETYGTVEMGVMAWQRPGEAGLSLIEDCTWFEFLDEHGKPAQPGQLARLVVTDLHGGLMPFVRYDQGDLVVYGLRQDAQGNTRRVIERIVGRQDDVAPLGDGSFLTYLDFYEVMDRYDGLRQFRVTQLSASNHFVIELVAVEPYLQQVHHDMLARLMALSALPLRFEFKLVDDIAPGPGGKRRMLVSEHRVAGAAP